MVRNPSDVTIETTLGESIAAVAEVAFENAENAEEAYALAAVVLCNLLAGSAGKIAAFIDARVADRFF